MILLAAFIENLQERNVHRQSLRDLRPEMRGNRESRNLGAPRVRNTISGFHTVREKAKKL